MLNESIEKIDEFQIFLANFAMGRNTEAENLTNIEKQQAWECWKNICNLKNK